MALFKSWRKQTCYGQACQQQKKGGGGGGMKFSQTFTTVNLKEQPPHCQNLKDDLIPPPPPPPPPPLVSACFDTLSAEQEVHYTMSICIQNKLKTLFSMCVKFDIQLLFLKTHAQLTMIITLKGEQDFFTFKSDQLRSRGVGNLSLPIHAQSCFLPSFITSCSLAFPYSPLPHNFQHLLCRLGYIDKDHQVYCSGSQRRGGGEGD